MPLLQWRVFGRMIGHDVQTRDALIMNLRQGLPVYLIAVAVAAAAVGLRWLLDPWLHESLPLVTLYAAVAVAVWLGGYLPALLAMVLGYLACNYLFIEPRGTFSFGTQDLVGIVAYGLTCSIMIALGEGMRSAERRSAERGEAPGVTVAGIGSRRGVVPGLVLVGAASLVLFGLQIYQAFWNAPEVSRSRQQVVRTFEVIAAAKAVERTLSDAQSSMRAYVLMGDDVNLARYRAAVSDIPSLSSKLKQVTADNPEQQRRMPVLERLIAIRLAQFEQERDLREREGVSAATAAMRTAIALDTASAIRQIIDAAIAAENELLSAREARATANEREAAIGSLAGGVLALVVLGLGGGLLLYAFRSLRGSEQALRDSEGFLSRLFAENPDALLVVDRSGSIVRANPQADTVFGGAPGTLIGRNVDTLLPERVRPKHGSYLASFFAAPRRRSMGAGLALSGVRADGTEFPVDIMLSPLPSSRGELVIAVVRDITERQRQQEALEQARAALAQSQKMEALGQLTGGIAHDFNNFLQVILGSITTLQRRLSAGERDVGGLADAVRRSGERAAALTRQLLAFARRQPLEPRPIDPNRLVAGMTDLLKRSLGETVSIEIVAGAGVWAVSADANQLESALLNLALNARDAMPGGGKLTIETTNAYLDQTYAAAHSEVQAGQYVMIAVSDSGRGMAKEVIAKAFDPFFTTKGIGEGTGLGLSQVHGFIKQSGGHVNIYSEPGTGTTVKIYLPRLAASAAADFPVEPRPHPVESARETILLVEDDEDVRAFVAGALSETGYRVIEAGEAASALRLLDGEPKVDLLFTDVGLPNGVNGRQLADEAQRRRPALKVLFTTGYARNAIVHHGRLDAGVELIGKPFTEADLVQRVRRVLQDS
jgi:PAS domain S-box-containing protein